MLWSLSLSFARALPAAAVFDATVRANRNAASSSVEGFDRVLSICDEIKETGNGLRIIIYAGYAVINE